ncbi:hypothetical protein ACFX2J_027302 [Malus domestica]
MIDAASGSTIMTKIVDEASTLFNTLVANSQNWGGEGEQPKKVIVHEIDAFTTMAAQISNLNKKFDSIMSSNQSKMVSNMYEICAGPFSSMDCPMKGSFLEFIEEQANQIGNFNRQQFNPSSDKYNPGWFHHPNFAWKNN